MAQMQHMFYDGSHNPAVNTYGPFNNAPFQPMTSKPNIQPAVNTAYQPLNANSTPACGPPTGMYVPQANARSQPLSIFRSLRWWLVDIFATFASVLAFIAIIVLLRHYEGSGVTEVRLPIGLNLTGLLSLLATVSRVGLMVPVASALSQEIWTWLCESKRGPKHRSRQLRDLELSDNASRGAWGSFLFLFRSRRSWLAYCAAILTILSLGFGTFTQQLLTIAQFPVRSGNLMAGTVPRATYYDDYRGRPSEGALEPSLAIKAAAYNSVLTSSGSPLTASCPTGNCTWPTTPSLAVCGGCTNITWERNCREETAECNYYLPSSGEVANLTNFQVSGQGLGFTVFPTVGGIYQANTTDRLYFANFNVVGAPNNSLAHASFQLTDNETVAAECALWMCLQTYSTRQITGQTHETILAEHSTVDDSQDIFDFSSNITFVDLPPTLNALPGTKYMMYRPAAVAFNQYFTTLFNGSIFLNQGLQQFDSDIINGIWNSSSTLDPWIRNVAGSLTNAIRSVSNQNNHFEEAYLGTASQLGYRIRWPWIILPGVMVLLSLIVLVVSIMRTSRIPVRAWKGSPLTVLFMDVDPGLRARAAQGAVMDEFEGIESALGKTEVVLSNRGEAGWMIVPK